jgi:hypothetical protein
MALLTLPPAAPQRGDRTTFSSRFDAFITWLVNFVTELIALVSGLNVLAAGGAYAFSYTVDLSSTADADPTLGKLRFNAATQNAATSLFLDLFGADGIDNTALIDQFDTSTSIVKGQVRIVKQGDPTKFLTFDVTARITATGYRKLTVTNTGGSSANPFGPNEAVLIKFTRTGDKGDIGPMPVYQYAKFSEQYASNVNGAATGTGTVNRGLNTTDANTISGASLSSGAIVLPAGTYDFRARACVSGTVNATSKTILANTTDSITYVGSPHRVFNSAENSDSYVTGRFTIAAPKTFRLQSYVGATAGTFGSAQTGGVEIYSEAEFWKLA